MVALNIRRTLLRVLLAASLLIAVTGASHAEEPVNPINTGLTRKLDQNETLLAKAVDAMREGHLDDALHQIEDLLKIQPDFRLAQLIRGDLLLAHAQSLNTIGDTHIHSPELENLRAEACARLDGVLQPPPAGAVPAQILKLDDHIRTALVVDTAKSRMYVFTNQPDGLHYLSDFYVTIGKNGAGKSHEGDQRTPLGVYTITRHLTGHKLPSTYGPQAFPLNFPNDWDKHEGSSGHGIWLHGTYSGTYSRPPHASDGCVVLTNNDLDTLAHYLIPDATTVVITDHIHWISRDELFARRADAMRILNGWRHDWESRNTEHYLANYANTFYGDGMTYKAWAINKHRVNQGKNWITINLSRLSLFEYPGQDHTMMADFEQQYHSNNVSSQSHKHQYWHLQNGHWKIVVENSL